MIWLLCSYWKGNSSLEDLLKVSSECEDAAWKLQKQTGECTYQPHSVVQQRTGLRCPCLH